MELNMQSKDKPIANPEKNIPLSLHSEILAALTVQPYAANLGDTDIGDLISELIEQNKQLASNDTQQIETMLFTQAKVLQVLFSDLVRRAARVESIGAIEQFLRLGLKSQAQCTRTLEVLAGIKNPMTKVAFVSQANIGQAVQVNNNAMQASTERKNTIPSNELLEEEKHEQWLDTRTEKEAVPVDSHLESIE